MQLKEPGFGAGYLQFNLSGGDTSTEGSWDAQSDENAVTITSQEQYEQLQKAKSIIEDQMDTEGSESQGGGKNGGSSLSDAERLEKYHDLFEKDAITEEEFQEKKAEILGSGG
jgi:hypothetical protein